MADPLLIKTSSLGDVIHMLPALTDLHQARPDVRVDWVVEKAFAEIPAWHPAVGRVIPVEIRRWRKQPLQFFRSREWETLKGVLQDAPLAVDAQGLLKSAWMMHWVSGERIGYDRESIREPLASLFYSRRVRVSRALHAIERNRLLLAAALGYPCPDTPPDFGIGDTFRAAEKSGEKESPGVFLLHGTTWRTKHWPEAYWSELVGRLVSAGIPVTVTWGNETERQRAERLQAEGARVLPRGSLTGLAHALARARAVVTVDTGLGHLAAALDCPVVALFGPTSAQLTGLYGREQTSLQSTYHCSPCFRKQCRYAMLPDVSDPPCWQAVSPERVWRALKPCLKELT
ncbi:lipopolysaccharide heptosyltransferase I [Hahella sp. SMD15-11]|uniref:Lipopolysaccharide heptosyltransferase 1 n=1 Tax=Thermohahella caldifontis TaxID=3142973 RepID=A0AB39UW48_9GAMM